MKGLGVTKVLREKTKNFIESAGKDVRLYQLETTLKCLKLLKDGSFILKVPQGTGKSLISQMIIRHRLDLNGAKDAKALVIAPTIELRRQYVRLAEWFGRRVGKSFGRSVRELDESKGDWRDFKKAVEAFSLLVVTPKFLANRLEYMKDFWHQIDLCVLDEVDLWSIMPLDQGEARPHRYMETIFPEINTNRIPIVGLTGTQLSTETRDLFNCFGCSELYEVNAADIGKYLPRIEIVLMPCSDSKVVSMSNLISIKIDDMEKNLRKKCGSFEEDIYKLVMRGCAKDDPLALQIRNFWGQRTRLHEDMIDNGPIKSSGKQKTLLKILKRESRVIVYAREVRMVEHLAKLEVAKRTIGLAHSGHRQGISDFQNSIADTLIMTRSLGLRGLDFPDANSMVLVSAKRDWKAMDQEMCRIRGQRRHRPHKCVYLLYYAGTYEEKKIESVISHLLKIKDGKFQRYSVKKGNC